MNPYQGLKQWQMEVEIQDTDAFNYIESLSGIETTGTNNFGEWSECTASNREPLYQLSAKQKAPHGSEEPLRFLINGLLSKLTGIAVAPT